MSENRSETDGMSRLQKIALIRALYTFMYYCTGVILLWYERNIWIIFFLVIMFNIYSRYEKMRQKRNNPSVGNQLDEFETRIELHSQKTVSQGSMWYCFLIGLVIMLAAANSKSESVSLFTFLCFIFGIAPAQELLHLWSVFYYTNDDQAVNKPERLLR